VVAHLDHCLRSARSIPTIAFFTGTANLSLDNRAFLLRSPTGTPPADAPRYDNLRLFWRTDEGWRLVAWVNESVS
jgi:hypothetical protein